MSNKKKIAGFSNLRVWATLLVIIGHGTSLAIGDKISFYNDVDLSSPVIWETLRVVIYKFHMPLFVMLSGALFSYTTVDVDTKRWILKRAKRLLVPYLLTGIFLLVPVRYIVGYYDVTDSLMHVLLHDIGGV